MSLLDKNIFEKTRMFVPQHRSTLEQSNNLARQDQPVISKQKYKEFSGIISEAVLNQTKVKITLYSQSGDENLVGIPVIDGDLKVQTDAGVFIVPNGKVIGICAM